MYKNFQRITEVSVYVLCTARRDERKLFALAFMRSMKNDGTAVEDKEHELFLYKVGHRLSSD